MSITPDRLVKSGVFVAALSACSASTPPPAPPPTAAATVALGPAVAAPLPELTVVPRPADLVAVGRWRAPGQTLDTLVGWSGLPLDWRRMLSGSKPGVERVLKLDAPVEALVVLDRERGVVPGLALAYSIGLSSLDEAVAFARDQGYSVTTLEPGTYRIGEMWGDSCLLGRALGSAPARLVCGERARDVERLYPYATRGLPTESLPDAEIRIEVKVDPLREYTRQMGVLERYFLHEWALDDPAFDRGLGEIVRALGNEVSALAEDAEQIALSLDCRPTSGVEAVLTARWGKTAAFTSQTLADMGRRATLPPELFWRLPADATGAFYTVSPDLARWAPIRRRLGELVDGYLEQRKVSKPAARRLDQVIGADEWSGLGSAWVGAHGTSSLPASSRSGGATGAPRAPERWTLLGFQDLAAEKLSTLAQKLVTAYGDREAQKLFGSMLRSSPEAWPRVAQRAAVGFGRGSVHYVIEPGPGKASPDRARADERRPLHVLIVPSGQSAWVSISNDQDLASAKLKLVTQGGTSSLKERAGFEALRQGPSVLGGFTTLAELGSEGDSRLFKTAPNRGESPILDKLVYTDRGPVLDWRWTMPRAAIGDVASVLPNMARRMFSE